MPKINRYIFNILQKIYSISSLNHQKAYLVGGFIRDFLLDKATNDIDIAVTGDAPTLAEHIAGSIQAKYFVLDAKNRVARLEIINRKVKYHIDLSTIEYDLGHDLDRRDFTINSIFS